MRYLSREMQRQIAHLAVDARLDPPAIHRLGEAIQRNNGVEPRAFHSLLENLMPEYKPPFTVPRERA